MKTGDVLGNGVFEFTPILSGLMGLDYYSSSIGIDFGGIAPGVKKIELVPDKDYAIHRINENTIALYVSTDNLNYTLIPRTDWEYQKDDKGVITLTLKKKLETRYLKLHVKYDERGRDFKPVNKATFLNEIAKMLRVYQEADSRTEEYQYDAAGNRKLLRVTLARTAEFESLYYTNSDRLKTDGKYAFVYDDAGNMIKKGNKYEISGDTVTFTKTSGEDVEYWEYQYDLLNRLVEVKKNGTMVAEYGYDPEGLRVVKRTKGITTHYVFEGTEPIFEKRISDGRIKSFVYALGKHLARVDGRIGDAQSKKYWYVTDHVGSIRAVTDKDGVKVWSANYFAFGKQFGKDADTDFEELHSFSGKELDPDTGLHYFNARWMDSETGRFISEDTIPIDPDDPRTLNLYMYGNNNPIIYIDLSGHKAYVSKISDDIYMYMSTSRQEDILKGVCGFFSFGGLAVKASEFSTGERFISDQDKAEALTDLLSTITDFTSTLSDMKDSGLLSTLGEISNIVGSILNLISFSETLTDTSYITDQIVGYVVGTYLESSSEKGVVEKYAYAQERVEQLVDEGKITYKTDIFGNVTDVHVDKNTQEKLEQEIMLIDAARVKAGEETEDQFRANYGGKFDTQTILDSLKGNDSETNSGGSGTDNSATPATPATSDTSGGSETATGNKIICAELFRQGFMDRAIYEADEAFGEMLQQKYPIVLTGYHTWAKPIVRYMKKSMNFTHLVNSIAKPWSYEMAYVMGNREKGDLMGKVLMCVGFVICFLIGLVATYPLSIIGSALILIGTTLIKRCKQIIRETNLL